MPSKQPKRGRLWLNDDSCVRLRPRREDHVWAYDIMHDRTHDGRPLRILTLVDEYTRECLAINVARRMTPEDVLDQLAELFIRRAVPAIAGHQRRAGAAPGLFPLARRARSAPPARLVRSGRWTTISIAIIDGSQVRSPSSRAPDAMATPERCIMKVSYWIASILSMTVILGIVLWYTLRGTQSLDQRTTFSNRVANTVKDNTNPAHNQDNKIVENDMSSADNQGTSAAEESTELDMSAFVDPEISEEGDAEGALVLLQADHVWKAQDQVMDKWPEYSDVQEALQEELLAEIDPNVLSDDEIVQIASELREKFWHAGGGLSYTSYVNAYKARVLLELVHNRNPKNMVITDELVETIQTAQLLGKFDLKEKRHERNDDIVEVLLQLRAKQYEQLRDEIAQGREPTMADFVRSVDLAFLCQSTPEHIPLAKETVHWLRSNANRGGWAQYDEALSGWEKAFDAGYAYGFNIYVPTEAGKPKDVFRYGRRLPSFLGPKERGRGFLTETPGVRVYRKTFTMNPAGK